jgi:hypothetical protein
MRAINLSSFGYIFLLAFILNAATSSLAQNRPPLPRLSPRASVMQIIGTTEVTITYGRPGVRGRTIFGDWPEKVEGERTLDDGRVRPQGAPVVPFGHIWRAGADEATLFTVNDDVLVNGQLLPAGRYSFHAIPGREEWTLIFNKDEGQWGSFNYDKGKDALRVKTKAQWVNDSKERLTYGFDTVNDEEAVVYIRWEKVKVPFTVKVRDSVSATIRRLEQFFGTANPTDAGPWISAANYAKNNDRANEARSWFEKALELNERSIAQAATFQNLSRRGNIYLGLGRTSDAISAFEAALAKGKESNAPQAELTALEKRIADLKAPK